MMDLGTAACTRCKISFTKKRKAQHFCSRTCRAAFHQENPAKAHSCTSCGQVCTGSHTPTDPFRWFVEWSAQ